MVFSIRKGRFKGCSVESSQEFPLDSRVLLFLLIALLLSRNLTNLHHCLEVSQAIFTCFEIVFKINNTLTGTRGKQI